jgi:lysophospholipase L1-like esterase
LAERGRQGSSPAAESGGHLCAEPVRFEGGGGADIEGWRDRHTFVLRQNKAVHYEAPFLYLFCGNDRALLLDTGATADPGRFPLRETVDAVLADWLADHPRTSCELVVVHTHAHSDHVAGDTRSEWSRREARPGSSTRASAETSCSATARLRRQDAPGFGDKGTARFQRDALDRPGVRTAIVLEGINDIGASEAGEGEPVTAERLIEGYRTLIRAAHARVAKVIGATIMPVKGTIYPGYHTEHGEAIRDAVNHRIRTGGTYDAVVDLDRALADPAVPDRLRPEYEGGDGLHPNDLGMRAIAAAIDLNTL